MSDLASPLQIARKGEVVQAFRHAWDGYSKYCFGRDTLHPVTNTCEDDFGGYGATAIDSLPTAIMFGKEDIAVQIMEFIAQLDFTVLKSGTKMQFFEVTIRHLAGMISAWDLLHGPFSSMVMVPELREALYSQMVNLGNILACAFNSPSGLPYEFLDPAACQQGDDFRTTVAAAGTVVLEFGRLSDITGNDTYVTLARKAEEYLLSPMPKSGEPFPGLLGSHLSLKSGYIVDSSGSWGAFADCKARIQRRSNTHS